MINRAIYVQDGWYPVECEILKESKVNSRIKFDDYRDCIVIKDVAKIRLFPYSKENKEIVKDVYKLFDKKEELLAKLKKEER
jgi:hypothetical protein